MTDMVFTVNDTVRARTMRLLTTAHEPLTSAQIAGHLGIADRQVQRALRELENRGQARRERGRGNLPGGGRVADRWTASE